MQLIKIVLIWGDSMENCNKMTYKDSIEWLTSLKNQIGQAQHQDLWHFEQALAEIVELLKPLAEPHGRLIDADALLRTSINLANYPGHYVRIAPTIIEAEV